MASNYRRAYNLREKARRRINNLKKTLKSTTSEHIRSEIRKDIRRLQTASRNTRTYSVKTGKQIHNSKQVARGIEKLSHLVEEFPLRGYTQKNRSFQIRINLASSQAMQGPVKSGAKSLSEQMAGLTKDEIKVFYRATQNAWDKPDVPVEKRNQAIMSEYGIRDLEKLFNLVLSDERNKDVVKALDILDNPDDYTDSERKWANEVLQDNEDEVRYLPVVTEAAVTSVSPVAPM